MVLVLGASAVALGIAWIVFAPKRPSASAIRAQTPTDVIASTAATPTKPKQSPSAEAMQTPGRTSSPKPPARELPAWNAPFEEAVAQLREMADAGDVDAQSELTGRLSLCTAHAQREAEASDERDRKNMEEDKKNERFTEEARAVRAGNMQRELDRNAATRSACSKLPPELLAHWLDPLDRAAQSGNIPSMRAYAALAISDYDSVEAIVSDIDAAIERRDKARHYLQRALASGDAESLADFARAYSSGDSSPHLFLPDPFQEYAYAYAGTLAGLRSAPILEGLMQNSAQSLDANQLGAAEAEGRRLYEQCCRKR